MSTILISDALLVLRTAIQNRKLTRQDVIELGHEFLTYALSYAPEAWDGSQEEDPAGGEL